MATTIDERLERLAELRANGSLTDEEFTAAKASALDERATTDSSEAASEPIQFHFSFVWMLLAAVILGSTFVGLSTVTEWAAAQRPAAIAVCPSGSFQPGFKVSHSVATKGVDFASACVKNGTAHSVSGLFLMAVLAVEYTAIAFLVLLALRTVVRARASRRDIDQPSPGAPA
ncbi:MAG TPA: SHOCT domain-containing protein [Acidimicrobiia bacterium]|nr:SHOCT domain-containing protein [Acidimicrobiia bacterium]